MARVTVKTLAAAIGVSPSTVSNAYNRPDQLSPDLRARILATAASLGYAGPDAVARSLRSGRAGAVGVLLTERLSYAFSDPYAIGFLAGLSEVVEQQRISVVLMPLGLDDGEPDVTAVRQANIDAMTLLCIASTHPAAQVARSRGIRLVGTDADPDPDSVWVAIDDVEAGALVGRHLAALGHRSVMVIADTSEPAGTVATGLALDQVTCIDCAARLRGLTGVLGEGVTIASGGHNAVHSGAAAASAVLSAIGDPAARPTAIVGLSDVLALGVLHSLSAAGLTAPDDVSVVGFDDVAAAAEAGLTTVRQPIREKGRRVGQLLLDPDPALRQVLLPIELMARRTTGPARA